METWDTLLLSKYLQLHQAGNNFPNSANQNNETSIIELSLLFSSALKLIDDHLNESSGLRL